MKITLQWLKQYVDFDGSPEDLAERLTMLGIEVEGMQRLGGEFEGVVVAQVVTRDAHPNADKLTLCRVNDGRTERQIVCGATNFKAGDKVPLILPGASLPAKPGEPPLTIKVGKIRGVESQGMLCSPKELGLADDAQGLLILPADAVVGQSLAEHLGRTSGDVVYDLEITPNRPDLNSVIGIAREISALTGNPLRVPTTGLAAGAVQVAATDPQTGIDHHVAVRLDDSELCPRYTARLVRGVKIGPSPAWLRDTLEKVGVRSICNVVDVTNYVMLEIGQPLHAFDYHLIGQGAHGLPTIVVRRAGGGERFTTLDGQTHELNSETLLIADPDKGIALAGIMGGQNTEIQSQTSDVLIESAYFKPTNIRRTSKALGLRTESSYRFERGADPGICDWASQRAAQLILETAGGTLVPGVIDACPTPISTHEVTLYCERTCSLLGVEIPPLTQVEILQRLGLDSLKHFGTQCVSFRIPTFRVDLKREIDLIEEICRLHGVDKIPATPPRGAYGQNPFDTVYDTLLEARRLLAGLGLNEAQGQTLVAQTAAQIVLPPQQQLRLAHPLSSDMNVLRPSLLPGLLDTARHNFHHKNDELALFELGRVFFLEQGQTAERWRLAVVLSGHRPYACWADPYKDALVDIYDLKGLLEEFLERFGLRGITFSRSSTTTTAPFLEPGVLLQGKQTLGQFGQLSPPLAKHYDARHPVLLAELDLDQLLGRRLPEKSFKPLPAFPASRRDVAMFVPEAVTHNEVLDAVRQAKPQFLEKVDVFDLFRGQNVPAGQKSLAYAFVYRSPDRTLTETEVNTEHAKVVDAFKRRLQATVREG